MRFEVVFKPLARHEVSEAYAWYQQPHIGMGDEFLDELERTRGFIAGNPYLYPRVEDEMRCANLNRFPYSLFYVIEQSGVSVLSCFMQHRDPKSRAHLLRPRLI